MGNKNDGNTTKQTPEKIVAYGDDGLEIYGNADAKKLAQVYRDLSKDGLSDKDKQTLKSLDTALKGAELSCTDNDVTLVIQHENNTETVFGVLGHGLKQNAGFVTKPSTRKL